MTSLLTLDMSLFSTETLMKQNGDHGIEVREQVQFCTTFIMMCALKLNFFSPLSRYYNQLIKTMMLQERNKHGDVKVAGNTVTAPRMQLISSSFLFLQVLYYSARIWRIPARNVT